MSLQVWFPLIGDMHNQGLAGNISFSATPSFSNDGILGKCLSTNRSYISATISQLSNKTEWSICFWVKVDSSATFTNYAHLFNLKETLNDGSVYWINAEFRSQDRVGAINFHVGKETAVGSNTNTYFPTADHYDAKDKWCHFAFTKDATYLKKYINGSLEASYACNTFESGVSKLSTSFEFCNNNCPAFLNDFRIYDNVLAAEEIKKISRGLVAHYTLDRFGCDNLIPDSYSRNSDNWTHSTRVTIDEEESAGGMTVAKITGSSADWNACTRTKQNAARLMPYSSVQNKIVTFSCWMKCNSSFNQGITFALRTSSSTSRTKYFTAGTFALTTEWKRYSFTITLTDGLFVSGSGTVSSTDYFFIEVYNHNDGQIVWTKGWKLELSDKVTPWIPNSGDAEYTKLGLNNNIEYDISGFGYNGTRTGTFDWSSDTPKYRTSQICLGSNYTSVISPCVEVKTVSLWVNWDAIPSGQSVVFVDGKSHLGLGLYSGGILCCTSGLGNSAAFNKTNLVANTWYHFVVVNPGDTSNLTRKLYINGVEQTANSNSSNWSYGVDQLQLGKRVSTSDGFVGKISDFRMYTTVLSADDVLALYQKRM